MKKKYSIIFLFLLVSFISFGQTYNMPNGSNGTITTCSGTFRDGAGDYLASQNSTITFCPSTPGDKIRITFTSFDTEDGYDILEVWNSNTAGAAGTGADAFTGSPALPFVITSTSPDGCISFRFRSDGSFEDAGWSATISCVTPCSPPTAALTVSTPLNICPSTALNPGSTNVSFNASASTTPSGSLVRYEWDWGDGTTSVTNTATTSHTFPTTGGIYLVRLKVRNNITTTDPLGCQSINAATRLIRVSPAPSFTGTSTTVNLNCGESTTLNGIALSQTVNQSPPTVLAGVTSLPNGVGVSYSSGLDFSGLFSPGATMTSACYPTLTFNLEHSYSGDLDIELIAPSGEVVKVYDSHGGGTKFGTCANQNDDTVPGCGTTYTVVNTGGVAWTAAGVTTTATSTCAGYTGACETGDYYISQTYNSTNPFTAFNGAQLNGVWTIRITDNLNLDDGTLFNWSLTFPSSCYGSVDTITPDLSTAVWTTSGGAPSIPAQTTTSTVVNNPGPVACPTAGACVGNQLTNNITVGPFNTAGTFTYNFTVTDENGCQFLRSATVNVSGACATANIAYTGSPFCTTSTPVNVNLTGTGAFSTGVFSAPAGLSINTATGQITPSTSTPGTYTVTYTIAPNACCAVSVVATTSVTISAGPTVTSLTSTSPICSGSDAVFNLTGTANSIVSYNINGGATVTTTLNASGTASVTVPSVTANTTLNATLVSLAGTPITGYGLSATGGLNPGNSTGIISASGALANATNCASVDNTNTTLTITLQNTVPAGTTITISIARDTNAGAVSISDGTTAIGTFNAAPNDSLQYINVTTTVATNTIVITRTGGIVWIDGVQYVFTPTGCSTALSLSNTVNVTPQNTIAVGTSQTVCVNNAITTISLATTGATGATVTGLPAGVTGVWASNTVTISGTPTASGTFNYTVTTTGGCPPATTTGTITVTPQNTIAAGTSQTVCINTPITTISLATTGATGATVTGLPAGVTGVWASNTVTISGTPTASGTFNYSVTTTGGCPPATTTGTITVTPQNTIAVGTSQTVCINTPITTISLATTGATGATVTGLPAGVTGVWASNTVTISGTPTASGTFNYSVTTTGGCPPATTTGTITVTPQNTIAAGTSQTVCINSAITTISLATTGATGATVTGLPAGVTGVWASNAVTISGTPTASGIFNYSVTTTGGCPPATTTGTITVTPQNTIAAGTSQTVCINSAITTISLATTGATGATVTGLPVGVTGVWASNTVTISGTPTASGTFNYTVTTTGGCPPATTTGTITVTPQNTIAAGTSQTVCVNNAITTISLATTGATGATVTGLPAGVTGTWSSNTVTISGTPTVAGIFNYTVTTTGGCPPATTTGTITVTPQNTIAAGTSQTVCVNSAITTISLATTGATGATVTGLPAGVTGTWASNTVTISGTPTASGTFNYSVTTTGGCPPATTTGTITVTPQNTIAAGTSQTVCVNNAITTISLATTGATGATVIGLPAGVTGTWVSNTVTISGTPTVAGVFNYTVTTTGGCPPATTTGTITVNPTATPVTGFSYPTPVCINGINPVPSTVPGFTTGGVYSSTAGLSIDGASGVIDLTLSLPGTYTVTYFYAATACGAAGSSTFNITISPLPVTTLTSVAATSNQTICINTPITNIIYAVTNATGATVSGLPAGVNGSFAAGVFTISGTPTASGVFNYTVTTTGGCTPAATATGTITVTPQNTIAAGTSQTVCVNNAITTISLATTGATGATVTGLPAGVTGVWASNTVTISGTPTASGTFNYTVTTTGGCPPATTTGTIIVTPQNTVAAGTNQTVCINTPITTISLATTGATGATVTGLPAGVTGVWSSNTVTISGTPTVAGTFNYTVTTTGGCPPATTTGTITVTPQNTIAAGTSQTVCINSAITTISLATTGATGATVTGLPAGVTGVWSSNTVTISGTPTVAGTFNYTVTTTGGCPPATTTGTITVTPQNTVAAGTSQTVCINTPITTISLATTGATGATVTGLPAGVTGVWASNTVTISGTPTASGTFNYTVTTTGGCPPATTTGTITVTPQNTIAAGTSQTVCINTPITTISLATTGATGATVTGLPAGVTGVWASNTVTISGTPTASGTFNYTVTTTGGCPPATTTGTITVNDTPNAGADGNITICDSSSSTIDLFSLITGEQSGGTWVRTSGTGGVFNATAGTYTPSVGATTSTFTYTIVASAPCLDDSSVATITINRQPFAGTDVVLVVCPQTASAINVGNLLVDGDSGGTWTQTSGPIGNFNPMSAIFTPPSGAAPSTSVFTYTVPGVAPCANDQATVTITVNRQAIAGTNGSTTVCDNDSTPVDLYSLITGEDLGGTWVRTSGTGGVFNAAAGTYTPSLGATTSTFTYTILGLDQCFDVSSVATINIIPQNTIVSGSNQTICIGNPITTISLATTGATGATVTGLPAGVTGVWSSNAVTISGTPTAAGIFNYTVTTTGGCIPAATTGTITVTPNNTVSAASSNPTACINTPIVTVTHTTTGATGIGTATGLPTGVTAVWASNTITISGSPSVSGTFNYSIPLTGGCGTVSATGTITVTPNNTVSAASSNPTACINTPIATITHTTTGATGIGAAIGLPAGVTAVWASNTITISGSPSVSGTFNYSIPLTGGCGTVSATGTITVTPNNTVSAASSNPTACINTPIATVTHTTTGATGIGVATGLPTGVTAVWASNTITISGSPSVSGTFNYSIPLTGGCGTVSATGTITVTPNNTVSAASSNPTACINTPIATVTHTTTGATGIGAATGLPTGVTAVWASNTITISGSPSVSGTFNYSIPLTGGCGTVSATGTITVTPNNTVSAASSNPTACINTPIATVTHTTTGATGIGAATGLPTGVTAVWASNTITISGSPSVSGTFNYSIPLTGGCGTVSATGTITVSTPATATISYPQTIYCITESPVSVSLTGSGNYTGGQFSSVPSGLNINPNTGLITPSASTPGNYQVNYLIPASGGCSAYFVSTNVTIVPRPVLNYTVTNTVCDGSTLNFVLSSNVPNTTYSWSATVSNISGFYNTTTNGDELNINNVVTLTNPETIGTITMVIIPRANGCDGIPQTVIITVNPNPVVEVVAVADTSVCSATSATNNVQVNISGNISGITYNWTAITNGVTVVGGTTSGTITATSTTASFGLQVITSDPLVAGTIYFEVSAVRNGCVGNTLQSAVVTVNPNPGVAISSPDKTICSGDPTDLMIDVSPLIAGTEIEWEVLTVVNVSGANPGSGIAPQPINDVLTSTTGGYVIYRVRTSLGECEGTYTDYRVNVDPAPLPILADGNICITADGEVYQTYTLNTGLNNTDYDFEWFDSNGNIIPGETNATLVVDAPGTYSVIATNWLTGCSSDPTLSTATATVTETMPATTMTVVQSEYFSDNATITVNVTGGTGTLMYSLDEGPLQSSNVFTGVSAGEHLVTVVDTEGCTYMTQEVTIIDYPNYFTPNGDGINDTWNISGLNQPGAKLYIFDRYGKLLKQLSATEGSDGWDGTYNQEQLPSTDYWFTLDYMENGVAKTFKAHFSLVR